MVFKEVAIGDPSHRGNVVKVDKIPSLMNGKPIFANYYDFDETLQKHIEEHKTIKGYDGVYAISQIIIDIDKKDDDIMNKLRKSIATMIDLEIPEDIIHPWFSGRGFHIVIPNVFGFKPSKTLPQIVKATLTKHFPEGDDIYDGARIIRVGYTKNEKSNLYKIPLTLDEIYEMSYEGICELAKKPRYELQRQVKKVEPFLNHLIVYPDNRKRVQSVEKGKDKSAYGRSYTQIITCMQKLYDEVPEKGSRHQKMLRLASSWKKQGIPKEAVISAIDSWAPGLGRNEVERTVANIYNWTNTGYGCNDAIMSAYCDPKCIYARHKDFSIREQSIEKDIHDLLMREREYDYSNSINFANVWDMPYDWYIHPGELVVVSGDTGLGKTSFVQHLIAKLNKKTLFFEFEMGRHLTMRRFVQIALGITEEQVKDADPDEIKKAVSNLTLHTTPPKIERLREFIGESDPDIIVIDTLDALRSDTSRGSEYEHHVQAISEVMDIAHAMNLIAIVIHHKDKSSSKEGRSDVYSLASARHIVTYSDKVIMVDGERNQTTRFVSAEKARDERDDMVLELTFDKNNTMQFVSKQTSKDCDW